MSASDRESPGLVRSLSGGLASGALALSLATGAVAADVPPATPLPAIAVWPAGTMPGTATDQPEHLLPAKGDNVDRVTDVSQPTIQVFRAAGAGKPTPAVVVCPGGGYSILAFNKEGTDVAAWLTSCGITAVVLKYRVPGNREGAFQDLQRALRLTRHHAAEWNLDPARIGVMGFSAGGHLCARMSTDPAHVAYPARDGIDSLPCAPAFAILVYPAYLEHGGKLAPELPVSAQTPPTLIVHTDDDTSFVAGSRVYHAALTAAGVANEFQLFATGGHGYGLRSTQDVQVWPERAATWLGTIGMR